MTSSSQHIAIYYHALRPRILRLVAMYEQHFHRLGCAVSLIASTPNRRIDIQQLTSLRGYIDELIVMGGDGSVNIAAQVFAHSDVPISVVPLGTGNDFARDNGIFDASWRLQNSYAKRHVALGRCGEHFFVNHAGAGLTVDLIRLQRPWMKRLLRGGSYVLAILRYLCGPYEKRSSIHDTETGALYDAQIVAVSRFIGGGIPIYPRANRYAGIAQWAAVPRASRWCQFKALVQVLRGHIEQTELVNLSVGSQFIIGDSEHSIELDGDCFDTGPQPVQVIPQGLTIHIPIQSSKD
ncbi:hypothetical protein CWE22_01880 [Pseudidiomarina aestuarii]|uniref:DAGKc domain-containing protein n=1 Tax=Pseudidiomarina aestuarii TaxID=624146 RepID=A0A7Z7ETE2_9GAMM|nr:diacylglycerol kinase family protein [Pseudidiomarina aestuarii]RUO40972.1 hypothetical protein CWE22_01880 [Pseudidiomarina aestuarii]